MDDIIVKSGEVKPEGQPVVTEPSVSATPAPDVKVTPSYSDDSEFELEGGEKITLKELKSGHLRQSDYTRKTQDLAKEKERLADFSALSDWINDPANKDKAEQVLAILEGKEIPKPSVGVEGLDPDDPRDKVILGLMDKVNGFEKETTQERQARSLREVTGEINQVKEKYHLKDGDEELDDIVAIVQGRGGKDNILKVADKYYDRLGNRDKTTIKKYLEDKDKDNKHVPLVGGGIPATGEKKKTTLEDGTAKRSLIERLKATAKANE